MLGGEGMLHPMCGGQECCILGGGLECCILGGGLECYILCVEDRNAAF